MKTLYIQSGCLQCMRPILKRTVQCQTEFCVVLQSRMTIVPHAGPHSSVANTYSPLLTYHHPKVFQLVVPKLKVVALTSGA